MLWPSIVGGVICVLNIAIHSLVMTTIVHVAHREGAELRTRRPLFLIAVMIPTVSILMITHALEVVVWSFAYMFVGAAPANTDLVYFAFVNYTTLGYGDVVPLERWRLLGPVTAMNGVLLFGWSTAVIFEVLRKALERTAHASR